MKYFFLMLLAANTNAAVYDFQGQGSFGTGILNRRLPPSSFRDVGAITQAGAYWTNVHLGNLSSGTNDVWSPPSGTTASVFYVLRSATNTVSTVNEFLKRGGVYYTISSGNSLAPGSPNSGSPNSCVINDTDAYSISTSAIGANLTLIALVFTNTPPVLTAIVAPLPAGQSTFYTVPPATLTTGFESTVQSFIYGNRSGGTRTVTVYYVPSGASVGTGTELWSTTVNDATVRTANLPAVMLPGDSIVVNTDGSGAGEIGFYTHVEVPQ